MKILIQETCLKLEACPILKVQREISCVWESNCVAMTKAQYHITHMTHDPTWFSSSLIKITNKCANQILKDSFAGVMLKNI